ncbi:MAG: hypothetical protein M3483_00930, partial [Gemmatimonadota bacterium]|nr:hypothetical protein [Gemmatimonadota bacterium]
MFAGTEIEEYLRTLQVAGEIPLYPWSIRAFSPLEAEALSNPEGPHPWAGRFRTRGEGPVSRVAVLP